MPTGARNHSPNNGPSTTGKSIGSEKIKGETHHGALRKPTVPAGKIAVKTVKEKTPHPSGSPPQMPAPDNTKPEVSPTSPHMVAMKSPKTLLVLVLGMMCAVAYREAQACRAKGTRLESEWPTGIG